jgi:hypothetical protein
MWVAIALQKWLFSRDEVGSAIALLSSGPQWSLLIFGWCDQGVIEEF